MRVANAMALRIYGSTYGRYDISTGSRFPLVYVHSTPCEDAYTRLRNDTMKYLQIRVSIVRRVDGAVC